MTDWVWVHHDTVLTIHDLQLIEHGGRPGVRDVGLLESALARPVNLSNYGGPDVFLLAAAYAFGLARNHPFVDGNKRTAFVTCALFLELNGWTLEAEDSHCIAAMLDLAAGEMEEDEFAAWLRESCARVA